MILFLIVNVQIVKGGRRRLFSAGISMFSLDTFTGLGGVGSGAGNLKGHRPLRFPAPAAQPQHHESIAF